MLIADLPIFTILDCLSKGRFPFSQKTLVVSQEHNVSIGIFTPDNEEYYRYWRGKFRNLLTQTSKKMAYILDITILASNNMFVKQIFFEDSLLCHITNIFTATPIEFQRFYSQLQKSQIPITLLYPRKYFRRIFPSPAPFHFTETFSFPFPTKLFVKKIALIYDSSLEKSYDEIQSLHQFFSQNIPSNFDIDIFSYPLTYNQWNHIFLTYDIIHYAGHIDNKRNIMGYTPNILIEYSRPRLVFLNGCKISPDILTFLENPTSIILFSDKNQIDAFISLEQIRLFYIGFFLGLPISDLAKQLPLHMRVLGYAHMRYGGILYEC